MFKVITNSMDEVNKTMQKHAFLTANALKLLACALMFVDHIHEFFNIYGAPLWLKIPGRLVFPLFLFLAADSFHYTRNRKAYMTRLFLGSLTMVVGTLIISQLFPNDQIVIANNAFSTFFVTGIYVIAYDWIKDGVVKQDWSRLFKGIGLALLPIVAVLPVLFVLGPGMEMLQALPSQLSSLIISLVMLIPNILTVEGGFLFVILGLAFYILRKNRTLQILALMVISYIAFLLEPSGISYWMVLAAIPMAFYNGQKGGGSRSFFYIFYPVHIYALYLISTLFGPILFK